MKTVCVAGRGVGLILYIIMGALVFDYLEKWHEEERREQSIIYKKNFLANKTCISEEELDDLVTHLPSLRKLGISGQNISDDLHWSVKRSLFFAMTIVTTIGYGHMVPTTAYSRVFFIFYALIGIPLFLIHIAAVGSYLNKLLKHCGNKLNSIISSDNKGRLEWVIALCFHVVAFAVLVLLPAFVLSAMEGWRYSESIYFIVVSLATVGFGDYVAGENGRGLADLFYQLFLCIWLPFGLAWFAQIVTKIQEMLTLIKNKAETNAVGTNVMPKD